MTDTIADLDSLRAELSRPSDALVRSISQLDGDILLLGAGGKMGPSLALMSMRATAAAGARRRIIAVSRFSNTEEHDNLKAAGIETIRGDLSDPQFVRALPEARNVLYLVGMKFGAAGAPAETWATNVYVAGVVADRFARSRIVALSTGNVYGLYPVDSGMGSREDDVPNPLGEYAMSALGRERLFEYFSAKNHTPMTLIRLNYATELRYGVLVDLAMQVYRGETVSVDMGYFNVIWQRDACDHILRSFELAGVPPKILNVTGCERVSVRDVCERYAEMFGCDVRACFEIA